MIKKINCPKCDDELSFEIEHHSAEDGKWFSAGFIADAQNCNCEFTEKEVEVLESETSTDYADGLGYDY